MANKCTFVGIADTSHAEVGGGEDDGRHVLQMTLKKLVSTLLMSEIIEDEMVGGGKSSIRFVLPHKEVYRFTNGSRLFHI